MIAALGQERSTVVGRLHSSPSAPERQTAAVRPLRSGESLTPPAWIAHFPSGPGPWRRWCLGGAAILVTLAFTLTLATGPISAPTVLYLPALLLVAAASRARWHAYGGVLLVVLLSDLAYQRAPEAVHAALPGTTAWAGYLVTRALTYSVVVLITQALALTYSVVVLITQALVHAIVTVQRYVVAMEAAHAQAWTLALTDPLTGLANRRRFDQHLETTIAQCHRDGTALALLLLDIDRFKEINDRWGHAAGDTALVQVAQALRASVGPGGLAARIGGDEFAVVLLARDESQARRVAQGVQGRLAVTSAGGSRGEPIQVSIGAASLEPRPAARAEGPDTAALTILMAADRALYQMKVSAPSGLRGACLGTGRCALVASAPCETSAPISQSNGLTVVLSVDSR